MSILSKRYCSGCGQEMMLVKGEYFNQETGNPYMTYKCKNSLCKDFYCTHNFGHHNYKGRFLGLLGPYICTRCGDKWIDPS